MFLPKTIDEGGFTENYSSHEGVFTENYSSYEGVFKENTQRISIDSMVYLDMKPVSKWTAFCRGLKGSIGSPSSGASLTRMNTPTIPRYRRSPDTGAGICL